MLVYGLGERIIIITIYGVSVYVDSCFDDSYPNKNKFNSRHASKIFEMSTSNYL